MLQSEPSRDSEKLEPAGQKKGLGTAGVEWLIIVVVALLYNAFALLDFDSSQLQQTGEHNEIATLALLAEISHWRYGEIPLWNPYMGTGFPHAGDLVNYYWHPISTVPVLIWGGINGLKVSIFLSYVLAGLGQWWFAHVFGVRGPFRLWCALLFMTSGALALLWRVGWYGYVLGLAWFPWSFAALWWALHRRDRTSLVIAALCIAMVLTTGGGYYPLYLAVGLIALTVAAVISRGAGNRLASLRRASAIALFGLGLAAVTMLPMIDGFRYTKRHAPPDAQQGGSQPITYALMNFVISEQRWLGTDVLGTTPGLSWFYIGALPLIGVALVPLALQERRHRAALLSLALLTLVYLAWHANKHTPVGLLYQAIPFLNTFRFPSRLLLVATSPLLVLAGLGLQHLFGVAQRWGQDFTYYVSVRRNRLEDPGVMRVSLTWAVAAGFLVILGLSAYDVFSVNKNYAFAPRPIDPKSFTTLSWLRELDPDLYYTNLGANQIIWGWTPASYALEMPVLNFEYNRSIPRPISQEPQRTTITAAAKYIVAAHDRPRPHDAEFLRDFDGIGVWQVPDTLPFAFSYEPGRSAAAVTAKDVNRQSARLQGPNRVVVKGTSAEASQLVVLVSNYPGWRLYIDDQPAALVEADGYLGAAMLPGVHTYTFDFQPIQFYLGAAVTGLASLLAVALVLSEASFRRTWLHLHRRRAAASLPG